MECRTIDPKKLSSSFLFLTGHNIYRLVNLTRKYTSSDITIKKSIVDNYEFHNNNYGFTYNCVNNTLYILKKMEHDSSTVLNVFDYNKNIGELTLTKQVPTIFHGAESIQSDWLTGKMYWVTHNDRGQYSIRVTDTSFETTKYVIENFDGAIIEMKIYPQKEGIFFISHGNIYWTESYPDSSVYLVFQSPNDAIKPEKLAIDYELEELCWSSSSKVSRISVISCINIDRLSPPLDVNNIVTKHSRDGKIKPFMTSDLVVFSNELYWIMNHLKNRKRFLFYQAANGSSVKVTKLNADLHYGFIFLNCPCTDEEIGVSMGMRPMHPHVSKKSYPLH